MWAGWFQDGIKLENPVKYLLCVLLKWQQCEINCSLLRFLAQQIWFNLLPADISKVMQAKKKRLECLTKNYMKGSQHKLEQLWNNYHAQRFDFILSLTEGKALNCMGIFLVCVLCLQAEDHSPVFPAGFLRVAAVGGWSPASWGAGREAQRWFTSLFLHRQSCRFDALWPAVLR